MSNWSPNHDPRFSEIRSQPSALNSQNPTPSTALTRRNATRVPNRGGWSRESTIRRLPYLQSMEELLSENLREEQDSSSNQDPQFSDIRLQQALMLNSPIARARRNPSHGLYRGTWAARAARFRLSLARTVRSPGDFPSDNARDDEESSPPLEERASKRRCTERSGQFKLEQLPMELRYCDGGRFEGGYQPVHEHEYSPECALRDDNTVYCTKKSRCNMILRHVDGDCFSLQKLVIRAPRFGFTSPVRAGMIFVTMDETDLLSRTNHPMWYDSDGEDTDEDYFRLFQLEPCEHDDEVPPQTRSLPPSEAIGSYGYGPPSSSSLWTNLNEQINQSRPPPAEPLVPNATFRHKDERKKCVINFEPAISGKYILAKFFSALGEKNIDIEFIGAYGWTGRRFFPAISMR